MQVLVQVLTQVLVRVLVQVLLVQVLWHVMWHSRLLNNESHHPHPEHVVMEQHFEVKGRVCWCPAC